MCLSRVAITFIIYEGIDVSVIVVKPEMQAS